MVKALDLRSNVQLHTWVRTPFLVWDPDDQIFFMYFFFHLLHTMQSVDEHVTHALVPALTFSDFFIPISSIMVPVIYTMP